jgi:hypothetical protein
MAHDAVQKQSTALSSSTVDFSVSVRIFSVTVTLDRPGRAVSFVEPVRGFKCSVFVLHQAMYWLPCAIKETRMYDFSTVPSRFLNSTLTIPVCVSRYLKNSAQGIIVRLIWSVEESKTVLKRDLGVGLQHL